MPNLHLLAVQEDAKVPFKAAKVSYAGEKGRKDSFCHLSLEASGLGGYVGDIRKAGGGSLKKAKRSLRHLRGIRPEFKR